MITILIIAALVYLALSSGKRKDDPVETAETETPGSVLGNMLTAIFFTFLAIAIILATVSIVAPLDKLQP